MKKLLIFVFIFATLFSTFAQQNQQEESIYKFKLGVDIPILSIGVASGITSFILHKKKTPLSIDEINALKPEQVNKFDRSAIFHTSKGASISSDVFYYTASVAPALLFIDKNVRKDWKYVLPMWAEVYGLTSALTLLTKELAHRKRPYVYNQNLSAESKVSKDATSSFFSGHTSVVAANTFFVAKVFADYHPDSKFKPLMWTGAALVPAITGLCRYGAGKHFFTDILVGYAVGATIGVLVPHLHRRKF